MDYRDFYIETEDLILKKAVHEDWKDMYYNLWRHEESAKYMLWEVTKSEEKAIERIEKSIEFMKKNKYALFIYEKKTGKAIGFGFYGEDDVWDFYCGKKKVEKILPVIF